MQSISEEALNAPFPWRKNGNAAWGLIAGNTYEHYEEHGNIIRAGWDRHKSQGILLRVPNRRQVKGLQNGISGCVLRRSQGGASYTWLGAPFVYSIVGLTLAVNLGALASALASGECFI